MVFIDLEANMQEAGGKHAAADGKHAGGRRQTRGRQKTIFIHFTLVFVRFSPIWDANMRGKR